MTTPDIVIAGYAETPVVHRSGHSAYELGADALERLLLSSGLAKAEIDGLATTAALSEGSNPFHSAYMAETLALEVDWLGTGNTGGCSMLCAVSAAAHALRAGQCRVAVVIGADAPSTRYASEYGAYRPEFLRPTGMTRPPGAFGLLQNAYSQRHGALDEALGTIAVTQRQHALLNEHACEKLAKPLTLDAYLDSRVVSDPLRVLDSVMFCDGANAVLMMRADTARNLGLHKQVVLSGYAERSNHAITDGQRDLLDSGFSVAGPRALQQAGLSASDVEQFHPYDDFTIAVLLQLEHIGFCGRGDGASFIRETDLSIQGRLPLNTGGGQLSAGQPGLAGGGLNLVEAVRQLFGEGGERQAARHRNALVTGIGGIAYGSGWMMSSALVLER